MLTFANYQNNVAENTPPEPAAPPYAGEKAAAKVAGTGKVATVDCAGLQCPGPIKRLKDEMDKLPAGDEIKIRATDPGFAADVSAWCLRNGHLVLDVRRNGALVETHIRKAAGPQASTPVTVAKDKKTFVVFSGDLDKVMAAFVIANGALAMGSEVTMFFTFWGLNVLRKDGPQAAGKGVLDRMFGMMMPKGPSALKLSNLHMLGMGTAMMKHVMRTKRVESLPELIAAARAGGAKMVACTMSMDVMGMKREELIDGIELGGVAAFLGEADQSNATLFI
jgi:peroxiredoxin family protein/TusA-related sulfurtransferase